MSGVYGSGDRRLVVLVIVCRTSSRRRSLNSVSVTRGRHNERRVDSDVLVLLEFFIYFLRFGRFWCVRNLGFFVKIFSIFF